MALTEDPMTRVDPSVRRDVEPTVQREHEAKTIAEYVTGGSIAEVVGAGGAIVLAILGLTGMYTSYLTPIAAIALGAALLLQGASVAARLAQIMSETGSQTLGEAALGTGVTTEFMGGAAGIVLGILALLNIVPVTLLATAAIVFGGTLLLGSGVPAELNAISVRPGMHSTARMIAREAVYATGGAQVLVGAGSVVLGILALVGFVPWTLVLVSMLAVGGASFLTGSALLGRMMIIFRRLHA